MDMDDQHLQIPEGTCLHPNYIYIDVQQRYRVAIPISFRSVAGGFAPGYWGRGGLDALSRNWSSSLGLTMGNWGLL